MHYISAQCTYYVVDKTFSFPNKNAYGPIHKTYIGLRFLFLHCMLRRKKAIGYPIHNRACSVD